MADNGTMLTRDDYINVKEGLGRVRDNKKLYQKMLGMFLHGGECASLEESLANKDLENAANLAHAVKGITGNLSLTALFTISTKMMDELRKGVASEELHAAFTDANRITREYVEEVMRELDA